MVCSRHSTAQSRESGRRKIHTMLVSLDCWTDVYLRSLLVPTIVIAGFFTGGALAIRGGWKSARNSAIACGCLLAVIEGVGIGFQRMMAENTRLDVSTSRNVLYWDDTDTDTVFSYHHPRQQQKLLSRLRCSHENFDTCIFTTDAIWPVWPSFSPLARWCFAYGGNWHVTHRMDG